MSSKEPPYVLTTFVEDSAWVVVDGSVYDVTEFLDEHPGRLIGLTDI